MKCQPCADLLLQDSHATGQCRRCEQWCCAGCQPNPWGYCTECTRDLWTEVYDAGCPLGETNLRRAQKVWLDPDA